MKNYSEELYQAIAAFLDEDGWAYDFKPERGLIVSGCSLDNALERVRIFCDVRTDKYIVFATIHTRCAPEQRMELAALLTRINYKLMYGCFEMDFSDGEVRFHMAVDCDGSAPSRQMVKRSILMPPMMMRAYGDMIFSVMNGECSADEAFRRAA